MMKKIVLSALVLFFTINATAQKINWVTIEEAQELTKKEPRKIIMDVYTTWCGPCKMLDENTFSNKDVINYINKNYYAVKFNGEGNSTVKFKDKSFKNPGYDPAKANRRNSGHEFAAYLSVRAYPTLVYFDEQLNVIAPISGYQTPQGLELYLKMFKNDDYKKMKSQEDFRAYYKAFKPTFLTASK